MCYGGMIRGVVAIALVMKIPVAGEPSCLVEEYCYSKEQHDCSVSTVLMIVIITNLFFGTFMKAAQKSGIE